jgi:hypothetical protein
MDTVCAIGRKGVNRMSTMQVIFTVLFGVFGCLSAYVVVAIVRCPRCGSLSMSDVGADKPGILKYMAKEKRNRSCSKCGFRVDRL